MIPVLHSVPLCYLIYITLIIYPNVIPSIMVFYSTCVSLFTLAFSLFELKKKKKKFSIHFQPFYGIVFIFFFPYPSSSVVVFKKGGGVRLDLHWSELLFFSFSKQSCLFHDSSLFLTSASFPPSLHNSPSLPLAALVVPSWAVQSLPSPENEF